MRKSGLIAIKLRAGDSLEWVKEVNDNNEVVMITSKGKCIRFNETDARPMGRASTGVRGIRLKEGDEVVEMDVLQNANARLFIITANGIGKCSHIENYRFQNRGGSGIKTAIINEKTGKVVAAKILYPETLGDLLVISKLGQIIRMSLNSIPCQGRTTQGVRLMRLNTDDFVSSISILDPEEEKKEEEAKKEPQQKTLV